MIHILGGKKVAVNFHQFLNSHKIANKVYFFEKEFGAKLKDSVEFEQHWPGMTKIGKDDKVIVSSETAFNNIQKDELPYFENHLYLRDKLNIPSISKEIDVSEIPMIDPADVNQHFPVIAKPKSAKSKVPFKFKIIQGLSDLSVIEPFIHNCIFQKYFAPTDYSQIAVAGYFINDESSLITVAQLNQYPVGVSSHIRLIENQYSDLKRKISDYLKRLDFTGFIEFEFKVERKSGQAYLIDINPRLWGWSYFYFSGIQNIEKVIFENKTPLFNLKSEWINIPRYVLSLSKMRFTVPKRKSVFANKISFEPFF